MECRHFRIKGKVQGVFYRANTQKQAQALGLTGWVRNKDNGDVECVACGEAESLDKLEQWLHQGPDAAIVADVSSKTIDFQSFKEFSIQY